MPWISPIESRAGHMPWISPIESRAGHMPWISPIESRAGHMPWISLQSKCAFKAQVKEYLKTTTKKTRKTDDELAASSVE